MLLWHTLGGRYSTLFYVPWLWIIILYIPPIILLNRLKVEDKESNTNGIVIFSVLFVFGTVLTILLQNLAPSMNEMDRYLSWVDTLKKSGFFLIPLEIVLIFLILKIKRDAKVIPPDPKVFISYNHEDSITAIKIKNAIEKAGIPVIIDVVNMKAGTDITEFIQNSLKEATAIVSLVSNKSLKSAWVAKESIDTIFLETYMDNKKFIACYLDVDFFQNDYTLKTVEIIDLQIKDVQNIIEQSHDKGIDTRDLNDQKSRLIALRNGLDGIIGRLRDSLSLDVRDNSFDQSMKDLLKAIRDDE